MEEFNRADEFNRAFYRAMDYIELAAEHAADDENIKEYLIEGGYCNEDIPPEFWIIDYLKKTYEEEYKNFL